MDIALDRTGDMYVSPKGDIHLTESVAQKIRIRLLWFFEEWRWDPEEGIPYFEDVFVKNPDTDRIEAIIRSKIFEIPEVTEIRDVSVIFNSQKRELIIRYEAMTDSEAINEEVRLSG